MTDNLEREDAAPYPAIIQGGMGIGVSNWTLARAVSRQGQLGVVSGTAIDTVLVRRLQDGDPGGHVRRAMEYFPIPGVCERVLERYFLPSGRRGNQPYAMLAMYRASGAWRGGRSPCSRTSSRCGSPRRGTTASSA